MTLSVQIVKLPAPELEFAGPGYFTDPRRGLIEAGPFDMRFGSAHRAQIRLAFVGTQDIIDKGLAWFERSKTSIRSTGQREGVHDFPGFAAVFRSELVSDSSHVIAIRQNLIEQAVSKKPYDGFKDIVRLYADAIREADIEFRPDVVVCCIPKQVEERFWSVQRNLSYAEKKVLRDITERRESLQFELPLDWEPEEEPEDLLRRDLRRALKAEAMRVGVPIQMARENLFIDSRENEDPAIRAWNVSVGIYYKGGGIPWRIRNRGPETCYVGITFHHLRTNKKALVYSALAQAFSSNGEGFALKGSALEPDPERRRVPHLTAAQGAQLGEKVLKEYIARNGVGPKRVVLHKSSRFSEDEQKGFRQAFRDIPVLQMVAVAPSSLRLVTHAVYPPARGTLLTINGSRHFLFTSGYIRDLGTYPGPHIPMPVELVMQGMDSRTSLRDAAVEVLSLGRLNWNTSDLRSSQPVTLGFARRVGGIMAEYGLFEEEDPDPSYRFYM